MEGLGDAVRGARGEGINEGGGTIGDRPFSAAAFEALEHNFKNSKIWTRETGCEDVESLLVNKKV